MATNNRARAAAASGEIDIFPTDTTGVGSQDSDPQPGAPATRGALNCRPGYVGPDGPAPQSCDPEVAGEFLRLIWPEVPKGYGLYLWHPQPGDDGSVTTWLKSAEDLPELNPDLQWYYGVGLDPPKGRRRTPGRRLTKNEVGAIPGLWLDIDCADGAHKAGDAYPTRDEALEALESFAILPTVVVDTGGGFHAYFLFDKPWTFGTDEERRAAQSLSDQWEKLFREIWKGRGGWTLDKVSDLSRVLRLPGTRNLKSATPRPVVISHLDGHRYTVDQLREVAESERLNPSTEQEAQRIVSRVTASKGTRPSTGSSQPGQHALTELSEAAVALTLVTRIPDCTANGRLVVVKPQGHEIHPDIYLANGHGRLVASHPDFGAVAYTAAELWVNPIRAEAARAKGDEAQKIAEAKLREAEKLLNRLHSERGVTAIGNYLAIAAEVAKMFELDTPGLIVCSPRDLDPPHFLGTQNGVIDLRTGQVLPFDEAVTTLTTKVTTVGYHPEARHWTVKKLVSHLPLVMREYVLAALGHALHGQPGKAFYLLIGGGDTGKSTLLEAVGATLGQDYAMAVKDNALQKSRHGSPSSHTDYLEPFVQSRFAWTSDMPVGIELDSGKLKSVSGGDTQVYRPPYGRLTTRRRAQAVYFAGINPEDIKAGLGLEYKAMQSRARTLRWPKLPELDPDVKLALEQDYDAQAALLALLVEYAQANTSMPTAIADVKNYLAELVEDRLSPSAIWLRERLKPGTGRDYAVMRTVWEAAQSAGVVEDPLPGAEARFWTYARQVIFIDPELPKRRRQRVAEGLVYLLRGWRFTDPPDEVGEEDDDAQNAELSAMESGDVPGCSRGYTNFSPYDTHYLHTEHTVEKGAPTPGTPGNTHSPAPVQESLARAPAPRPAGPVSEATEAEVRDALAGFGCDGSAHNYDRWLAVSACLKTGDFPVTEWMSWTETNFTRRGCESCVASEQKWAGLPVEVGRTPLAKAVNIIRRGG